MIITTVKNHNEYLMMTSSIIYWGKTTRIKTEIRIFDTNVSIVKLILLTFGDEVIK